jgi:hypothetical protein
MNPAILAQPNMIQAMKTRHINQRINLGSLVALNLQE